jgi:putative ABC transport system permease protein
MRRFVRRLVNLLRPGRAERELSREIASHLALLEDEYRRRGVAPEEARLAARRAFGGVEQTKEHQRDARSFRWIDDARRDLPYAARLLRRNPAFALTAALSLSIGIGANTTIFTVANALLFRAPTGVADARRLVDIGSSRQDGGFGTTSYPNYADVRQRATLLDDVYAYSLFPHAMSLRESGAAAERVFVTDVTTNYFTVLGATAAAGRLFDPRDSERTGAAPIAVLSFRFWTRRFNRDPQAIGRTLIVGGQPFVAVGVASEGFQGTGVRASDIWVALNMPRGATSRPAAVLENRAGGWLLMGGRLKPGVSAARANAEIAAIGAMLQREYPEANRGRGLRALALSPVPDHRLPIAVFLAFLTAIVSAVLVIACTNLAGVLLARATARRREIAVRLAMGAGRARLIRQLLAESLALVALGGFAGLLMARVMTLALVARLPGLPFPIDAPLTLDARALAFTAGLVVLAALFSGLTPALQATRADVVSALKDDDLVPARLRLRNAFVIAQVALSILLVVVAALFARALERMGSTDPGFDARGIALAPLDLAAGGYTDSTAPLFVRNVIEGVRRLPGVESATVAAVLPGGFERIGLGGIGVPGHPGPNGQQFVSADWNIVEPGYFATLRMPLVAGRDFDAADRAGTEPVVIIGEGAARRFWPDRPPDRAVGEFLAESQGVPRPHTTLLRVVGIACDPKYGTLIEGTTGYYIYVPLQQQYLAGQTMIVARAAAGRQIGDDLRAVVASIDPRLSVLGVEPAEDYTSLGLVPQRVAASVSGSLGLVGLLLAGIGVYGVTAYAVARRTREIGIRIAIGAQPRDVVRMVLRQGMSLVSIGSAIGLALAAGASRVLAGLLFGVAPFDPVAFSGATLVFALVGLSACYLPARRAVRIDAISALRHE